MQTTQQRRKVLIIAYLFPPIGGGGIQRPLKMAKYLGQFDWDVHVLTVEPTYHPTNDPSLLEQIPQEVTVHRCKEPQLWQLGRKTVKSSGSGNEDKIDQSDKTADVVRASAKPSMLTSIKRRMISLLKTIKNTINIPDDHALWYPRASRQAVRIIEEHDIDIIMSTSGPYTNHLIGRYAKKKTGKVWIADFRDPWTENMHRPSARWRQSLERTMEESVVTQCDCLLTVTHSFANNFRHLYGERIRQIEVIHNGFDQEDYDHLAGIIEARRNRQGGDDDKWRLVYTGIFYNKRNPRLLLQAIAALIAEGKLVKEDIVLQFAGIFDYPGNYDNISCVQQLDLMDNVEIAGHLPHKQALELMANADVLMLINDTHPDSGDYIPGKLYEYMAIGHPILALSLPGESTQIITANGLGEIAHPNNLEEIKVAVLKMYRQWKEPAQVSSPVARLPQVIPLIYARKEQARILAQLMNELTTASPI